MKTATLSRAICTYRQTPWPIISSFKCLREMVDKLVELRGLKKSGMGEVQAFLKSGQHALEHLIASALPEI